MSEENEERRVREALRALGRPSPSDAFRERVREVFLIDSVSAPASAEAGVPSGSRAESRRGRRRPLERPEGGPYIMPIPRRPRIWPWLIPLAAAAAITVYVLGTREVAPWVAMRVPDPSASLSSGTAVQVGDHVTSGPLSTGETEMDLALSDRFRLQLAPNTLIELGDPPGRWFGNTLHLKVERGEIRGTTGPDGLGFTVAVETDEADITVTGTTFAVIRDDTGTCVCLYHGGIMVGAKSSQDGWFPVPDEHRYMVHRDGTTKLEPITDMERAKLGMIHDQGTVLPR
jgi:hypothetical protein